MEIYIQHPEHGFHVVYSNTELESHQLNGWSLKEEKKEVPVQKLEEIKLSNPYLEDKSRSNPYIKATRPTVKLKG